MCAKQRAARSNSVIGEIFEIVEEFGQVPRHHRTRLDNGLVNVRIYVQTVEIEKSVVSAKEQQSMIEVETRSAEQRARGLAADLLSVHRLPSPSHCINWVLDCVVY